MQLEFFPSEDGTENTRPIKMSIKEKAEFVMKTSNMISNHVFCCQHKHSGRQPHENSKTCQSQQLDRTQ